MDYDVIVIGGGAAGEGAVEEGGMLGGRVLLVERDLVGGECSFWACMPSKSLLDSARRRVLGDYPWTRASQRRDWMISREGTSEYPDDAGHVSRLEAAGAELVRGSATIVGPGRVEVRDGGGGGRQLEARALVVATGAESVIPPIDGLAEAGFWTSRDGTSPRELPSSIVVLGGGPVGVELAQVYARFDVKTTLVEGNPRILARDHRRSSEVVADALRREGVDIRTGVRAQAVRRGGAGRVVELNDGTSIEGAELMVSVGRRPRDLRALGVEEAGVELDSRGSVHPDERMAVGEGVFAAGDAAGGMQFTHLADYEGRVAMRAALGGEARADLGSVPRTTFTDPETGAVGLTVEQAQEKGIDAFEVTQDFAVTARGFTIEPVHGDLREGSSGHVTIVVDRERRVLAGAFAACPGASEIIHLAVLGLKLRTPIDVLADTIGAFPTGARVLTNLFADAARQLDSK